jgi:molybdopterin molybdotransferase
MHDGMEWADARRLAHEAGSSLSRRAESLPLSDTVGRTLANALLANSPLPAHALSAMDGWAIAGESPWMIGAPILAGDAPCDERLREGTARAIATGAAVPPGAVGVLRSEHGVTRRRSTTELLERNERARPSEPRLGEHIRPAGEETRAGELILAAGSVLTAPRIGLAAASGNDRLAVVVRPEVDVVVLGSELVARGTPGPGQVRDAFTPHFPAVLAAMGLRLTDLRQLRDDIDDTTSAFALSSAPLLVSTGGSARGPADNVRAVLTAIGAELIVDGVRVRPGHPVMLARRTDGGLILCLPGNPLAAMLSLASLGAAAAEGMLGRALGRLGRGRLAVGVPNPGANTRLISVHETESGLVPTAHQGSGMLRGLACADAVGIIAPGGAASGAEVRTLPLPW